MKYIVKKTTTYKKAYKGITYITKHYSWPNELVDIVKNDGFKTNLEAHQYMLEVINRDYRFRKDGFKFEYEIVEVK